MSVEAMVQAMIDDLTAALVDAAKHDKGNSAAGTRAVSYTHLTLPTKA